MHRSVVPLAPSPLPAVIAPRAFPVVSVVVFLLGALVMRGLCVAAWAFFPGGDVFQHFARVLIPALFAAGLVALNRMLLRRDGFPADALKLGPRHLGGFALGAALAAPLVLLLAGALWVLVPFSWERGALSWDALAWQFAEYTAGNATEELIFRGYLLLVLARHLGLRWALLLTAVAFGLFHLPGLSGTTALKMVCTTAVAAYVFAYAFLLSGSLWTAIGLHAGANLVLHQVLGLSGARSILRITPQAPWPEAYDPAFLVWLVVFIPAALLGAFLHRRRRARLTAAAQRSPRSSPETAAPV